jgi:hypothetical protein
MISETSMADARSVEIAGHLQVMQPAKVVRISKRGAEVESAVLARSRA